MNLVTKRSRNMGTKLTPVTARALLIELFKKEPKWTRADATAEVERLHRQGGGDLGAQPVLHVVKKALGQLKKEGLICSIGKGLWAVGTGQPDDQSGLSDTQARVGIPLQPVHARKLILRLLGHRDVWHRSDLAKRLAEDHLAAGNELGTQDPLAVTKKALSYLQEAGQVQSRGKGLWSLAPADDAERQVDQQPAETLDQAPTDESIKQLTDEGCVVLGNGAESVYLYYFANDKTAARAEGRTTWDCKIGFATGDVKDRVFSQTGTGRSRRPVIAVVIRTDYPMYLEKVIHNCLKMADRHIEGERKMTGAEWFDTTPEQLISWWGDFTAAQGRLAK